MSIRLIARELYRAQKQVEELRRLVAAAVGAEVETRRRELLLAERELATLQKMLEARKDESTGSRTPRLR